MADDLLQQLLAQRSLLDCSRPGAKGAPILMGLSDVDCGSQLSLKGKVLNADKTPPALNFGRPQGFADKLFAAMGKAVDEMRGISQKVQLGGEVPRGTNLASNAPVDTTSNGPTLGT